MPATYLVQYSLDGSTWTDLDDVQAINISLGRQRQLDTYSASTASFTLRYPNGYATPNPDLVTGTYVRIKSPTLIIPAAGDAAAFIGRIVDVSVTWGKPYNGSVGQADYMNVTAEGFFAAFARLAGNNYAMATGAPQTQLDLAEIETGLEGAYYRPTGTDPVLAATSISGTWGDWLNEVATTINGRIWDCNTFGRVDLISPFYQNPINPASIETFADDGTGSYVYDDIEFSSYADNYWTQVQVTPTVGTTAVVDSATPSGTVRTLRLNTLNSSTGQATDYANYLLGLYSDPQFRPTAISCLWEGNGALDVLADQTPPSYPGLRAVLKFRGTTYQVLIEGVRISATPETSRYTFYLSAAEQNNYLILGNSEFGTLDYNRLGY
jgi:hypothetical protein